MLIFHLNFSSVNFLKKIFLNVYSFLRDRDGMNGGGAEREGDTESEAVSRL